MSREEKFIDLITEIVNDGNSTWFDKKEKIVAQTRDNKEARIAFEEFLSWFDEDYDNE